MEMAHKWKRHETVVNEDMVAFVEVPSNQKQFSHDGVPEATFLGVVLVFLSPGPSVCEKTQRVVGIRVAQHPKYDSPMVVVLIGQILHETDYVFGTHITFVDTDFLMRGVVMPEYPVCKVYQSLVPCTGISLVLQALRIPSLLMRWKKRNKWEKQHLVNTFPKHEVAWEQRVEQYDAMVGFFTMPIFRI
jgi:hypothetical protein